jgi:hypothetical protein
MDSEDEELLRDLRRLGGPAIQELKRFLTADEEVREHGLRALVARPDFQISLSSWRWRRQTRSFGCACCEQSGTHRD